MLKPESRLGNYEILGVLSCGHSATTYRARHVGENLEVAMKVPHGKSLSDKTFVFRFFREAGLGAKLNHPSIPRVLESGEERGMLFMVMELVEGTPLSSELAAQQRLPLARALLVSREVAATLAYAHGAGVVHRNLKPGHIMLVEGDRVRVLDLGMARAFGQVGLTSSDVFLGTPLYTAPEAEDPRALDHRSDLYSLGMILFEMLQGRPPYDGGSPVEILIMHKNEPFPAAADLKVGVPRAVWELMDRLSRKKPEDRIQSAAAVVEEFDRILKVLASRRQSASR